MSRASIKAVRYLQAQDELVIMTKSQEENVLQITINNENSNGNDSNNELNNAVIYDSDDAIIKNVRKWNKLRRLNNLSPRLKKMFEIKQKIMDFENKFPDLKLEIKDIKQQKKNY